MLNGKGKLFKLPLFFDPLRMIAKIDVSSEERGFSLIELAVFIAIIGIISYLVIFGFSTSTGIMKEKSLAEKVVSDVRYAQEMALTHRQEVKFVVEPDYNRYSLKWQDDSYLKTPIAEQDFVVDFATSEFKGVDLTSTGFSAGLLSFNARGQPMNNGTLLSTQTVLMRLNNNTTIKIVPITGACYIE